MKKRAVGYVRVSTQAQAQEGESLKTQRKQISNFIKNKKGWELVKIYTEKPRSGSTAEGRPEFQQMIEKAKNGDFQGIVFSRLSRFARNAGDFLRHRDMLKSFGVDLFSVKENIDPTTTTGKLLMGLMALIAEWEREMIAEQMGENKLILWRDGKINMGQEPFGYKWDREKKKLIILEEEKMTYLKMVDLYLNEGLSMKDIALRLNSEGVKGKRGRSLSSTTVGDILKNPIYYGHRPQNRYKYEYDTKSGTHRRTRKLKPEKDHIFLKAPAILDKLTWDKIQKKTAFNRTKSKRTSTETELYWLRDSLKCGVCGAKVKPSRGNVRKDGTCPRYYTCYWKRTSKKDLELHGKDRCALPYIDAEKLEGRVWMELVNFMHLALNPEQLKPLVDVDNYEKRLEKINKASANFKKELKKKEMAEERLFKDYEKDDDEFEQLQPKLLKRLQKTSEEIINIQSKLEALSKKRKELLIAKETDKERWLFIKNERKALKKLLKDIWKLPLEDRKTLIEASIEEPIKIEIDYRPPDEIVTGKEWRFRWGENSELNFNCLKGLVEKRILKQDSPDHPTADQL